MNPRLRAPAMLLLLSGLTFLLVSCTQDDHTLSTSDMDLVHRAEYVLLQSMAIDTHAVVSVVGPVSSGDGLCHWVFESGPECLRIPDMIGGPFYLFYVNDHPEPGSVHEVRWAWMNLTTRQVEQKAEVECPYWLTFPADTTEFELVEIYRISGHTFYYGHGGGYGFPEGYLP